MNTNIELKIKEILDSAEKAAEIIKNHPGESLEQIKAGFDMNIQAHITTKNHVSLFISKVLAKQGDLKTLADSAAKRIILSDIRLAEYMKSLKPEDKIKTAEAIHSALIKTLVSYFENFKGKSLNQKLMSEELTVNASKNITSEIDKLRGLK